MNATKLRKTAACFLLLLPMVLTAFLVNAQTDEFSFTICGKQRDAAHQWSWENITSRYGNELAAGNYQKIYQDLQNGLNASEKQKDRQIQKKVSRKLAEVIDRRANGRVAFEIYVEKSQDLRVRKKYFLFKGDPDEIDFQDCGQNNERADQLDEVRDFSCAVVNLSDREMSPARQQAVERIRKLEESYDRYLFEAFPMFPWEAAVNSVFLTTDKISAGPPHNQLIFFHLSAGFEVNTESMAESELGAVVAVEPLGWIRYPEDKDFRTWWGIAALTTFRHDRGIGVGLALHYNDFSLGATWHERDVPGSHYGKPFVFVGIDLYRYLDSKKRQYDQYIGKVDAWKKQYLEQAK